MNIDIRSAKNGLILKVRYRDDDPETEEVVHQQDEDDDVEAFAAFLYYLVENFGPSTSRYSPKRIYIRVEPGDKYEGPSAE